MKLSSLLFLLFTVLLSSCHKSEVRKELKVIEGDYQWVYSYQDINDFISCKEVEEQYAIRITKSQNFKVFKNQDLLSFRKITEIKYEAGVTLLVTEENVHGLLSQLRMIL